MTHLFKYCYVLLFCFLSTGCFEIFQTVEIIENDSVSSSIRVKLFEKNGKLPNMKGEHPFPEYSDVTVSSTKRKAEPTATNPATFTLWDFKYNIPFANLRSNASKHGERLQPPYRDENGQLLFVLGDFKEYIKPTLTEMQSKLLLASLANHTWRIYLKGDWNPKSANLILLSGEVLSVDVVSWGNSGDVLIELPMLHIIDGALLVVSQSDKVDISGAEEFVKSLQAEKSEEEKEERSLKEKKGKTKTPKKD